MEFEITTLHENNTWKIFDLPLSVNGSIRPNIKKIEHLNVTKLHWCQKDIHRTLALILQKNFFVVVKMVTVKTLLTIVTKNNWSIYQLDVNNALGEGGWIKRCA